MSFPGIYFSPPFAPQQLEPCRYLAYRLRDPNSNIQQFYVDLHSHIDAFNNYVSRVDAGERDFGLAIPCWNILLTHARKLEVLYMHPNHSLLVAEMLMVRDEFIIITNKIIQSYREEDPEIACWRRMVGDFDCAMWCYLIRFPKWSSFAKKYQEFAEIAYGKAYQRALKFMGSLEPARLIIVFSYSSFKRMSGHKEEAEDLATEAIQEAEKGISGMARTGQVGTLLEALEKEVELCRKQKEGEAPKEDFYTSSIISGFILFHPIDNDSPLL